MSAWFSDVLQENEQLLALITINEDRPPVMLHPATRFSHQILFTLRSDYNHRRSLLLWLRISLWIPDVIRKEEQSALLPYLWVEKWIFCV